MRSGRAVQGMRNPRVLSMMCVSYLDTWVRYLSYLSLSGTAAGCGEGQTQFCSEAQCVCGLKK